MTKVWLCSLLSIFFLQVHTSEYFYPVGTIIQDNQEKICVIQQKNMHLYLWFWNPETKQAEKGLSSMYNAAGLQVLPSKHAFSFIHNDSIRIKDMSKRSPEMLDLYGLYDFSTIRWINAETCYFSARRRGHLHLLQATIKGDVLCLATSELEDESDDSDYKYPQQVGESLFYIKKHKNGTSVIVQSSYKGPLLENENISHNDEILKKNEQNVLYVHEDRNNEIAFLTMKNDREGFFVSYPSILNKIQNFVTIKVFGISWLIQENSWQVSLLFSFSLPLFLIIAQVNKPDRLFESIILLLPTYVGGVLYWVDGQENLSLYQYDKSQLVGKRVSPIDSFYFSPYRNKEKVIIYKLRSLNPRSIPLYRGIKFT